MARFLHERDNELELALEDVFLLPGDWDGGSRREVSIAVSGVKGLSTPIISSNMAAVSGSRLVGTLARMGGLGVLHQDYTLRNLQIALSKVKNGPVEFEPALTVGPEEQAHTVAALIDKRAARMVVVVVGGKPIGIVNHTDLKMARDDHAPASSFMADKKIVVVNHGMSTVEMFDLLDEERIEAAPVVDPDTGELLGMVTKHDLVMRALVKPSLDAGGRLMVAATVGINGGSVERAQAAIEFGADVIVIDTAHGDQRKMREAIKAVRQAVGSEIPIVAGNVCTADGTRRLLDAGASIVKVNVGPGAMCTTRQETGVGRPTFSAVKACAEAARAQGGHVWADGAVRRGRDGALYSAAGADAFMVGTSFAGTYEAASRMEHDADGALYKVNYGMASRRAVTDRSTGVSAYEQAVRRCFQEGISDSRVYLQPGRDSVGRLVEDLLTGLMSSMTYVGARDLDAFYEKAVVGVQTASGFHEGTPHGKVRL